MPRKNIIPVTGEKYHVYNRGVDKRNIFEAKNDYVRFYQSLYLFNVDEPIVSLRHARHSHNDDLMRLVDIHAYVLLPNHFHLILEQKIDNGISEFMKRVLGGYTSYFNEAYERSGALFQGTYKKVHIENDAQYNYLFAYVNENYYVHGVNPTNDVYSTSSFHYQGLLQSKAINQLPIKYNQSKARSLAKDIYLKRKTMKDVMDI